MYCAQVILRWEEATRREYGPTPFAPPGVFRLLMRKVQAPQDPGPMRHAVRPSTAAEQKRADEARHTMEYLEFEQARKDFVSSRLQTELTLSESYELSTLLAQCVLYNSEPAMKRLQDKELRLGKRRAQKEARVMVDDLDQLQDGDKLRDVLPERAITDAVYVPPTANNDDGASALTLTPHLDSSRIISNHLESSGQQLQGGGRAQGGRAQGSSLPPAAQLPPPSGAVSRLAAKLPISRTSRTSARKQSVSGDASCGGSLPSESSGAGAEDEAARPEQSKAALQMLKAAYQRLLVNEVPEDLDGVSGACKAIYDIRSRHLSEDKAQLDSHEAMVAFTQRIGHEPLAFGTPYSVQLWASRLVSRVTLCVVAVVNSAGLHIYSGGATPKLLCRFEFDLDAERVLLGWQTFEHRPGDAKQRARPVDEPAVEACEPTQSLAAHVLIGKRDQRERASLFLITQEGAEIAARLKALAEERGRPIKQPMQQRMRSFRTGLSLDLPKAKPDSGATGRPLPPDMKSSSLDAFSA